jgi:hypothetical protein
MNTYRKGGGIVMGIEISAVDPDGQHDDIAESVWGRGRSWEDIITEFHTHRPKNAVRSNAAVVASSLSPDTAQKTARTLSDAFGLKEQPLVRTEFALAGEVSDFRRERFKEKLASKLVVAPKAIELTVEAASVSVTAVVQVPSIAESDRVISLVSEETAGSLTRALEYNVLRTTSTAGTRLMTTAFALVDEGVDEGVDVEYSYQERVGGGIEDLSKTTAAAPTLNPPSSPPAEQEFLPWWAIVLIVLGVGLVSFGVTAVCCTCLDRPVPKDGPVLPTATTVKADLGRLPFLAISTRE